MGRNPTDKEKTTDRVALTPSTKKRLDAYLSGLGMRATYDQLLNVLMDALQVDGSDYKSGRRLSAWLMDTPSPDDDPKNRGQRQPEAAVPSMSAGD